MLSVEQLSFRFPGRTLLDAVSFRLKAHSVTCLTGGNGSGKTTLFNLATGFLKPQCGNISVGEKSIIHLAPFEIARIGVARTFQELRVFEKLTVRQNLLLALPSHPGERLGWALLPSRLQRERNAADSRKADIFLADYFLDGVSGQLASEVSYGQQKLLTLACCAAMEADLLLLDEPAAGVSHEYRERIVERISAFKAAGKTILLIEHQPDFLEQTGDAFLHLEDGKLHCFDSIDDLRSAPVGRQAFD